MVGAYYWSIHVRSEPYHRTVRHAERPRARGMGVNLRNPVAYNRDRTTTQFYGRVVEHVGTKLHDKRCCASDSPNKTTIHNSEAECFDSWASSEGVFSSLHKMAGYERTPRVPYVKSTQFCTTPFKNDNRREGCVHYTKVELNA